MTTHKTLSLVKMLQMKPYINNNTKTSTSRRSQLLLASSTKSLPRTLLPLVSLVLSSALMNLFHHTSSKLSMISFARGVPIVEPLGGVLVVEPLGGVTGRPSSSSILE